MTLNTREKYKKVIPAVSQTMSHYHYVVVLVLLCTLVPALSCADIKHEPRRVSPLITVLADALPVNPGRTATATNVVLLAGHDSLILLLADASYSKDTSRTKPSHTPHNTLHNTLHNKKTKHTHHKLKHKRHVTQTKYVISHVTEQMPEAPSMPAADKLKPQVATPMQKMPKMPQIPNL